MGREQARPSGSKMKGNERPGEQEEPILKVKEDLPRRKPQNMVHAIPVIDCEYVRF